MKKLLLCTICLLSINTYAGYMDSYEQQNLANQEQMLRNQQQELNIMNGNRLMGTTNQWNS